MACFLHTSQPHNGYPTMLISHLQNAQKWYHRRFLEATSVAPRNTTKDSSRSLWLCSLVHHPSAAYCFVMQCYHHLAMQCHSSVTIFPHLTPYIYLQFICPHLRKGYLVHVCWKKFSLALFLKQVLGPVGLSLGPTISSQGLHFLTNEFHKGDLATILQPVK